MSESTAPSPLRIETDTLCSSCGYNLRTIGRSARCPECGTPAELTLTLGQELTRSRPGYIRRLVLATLMLFAARFGLTMGLIIALVLMWEDDEAMALLALSACALYGVGGWLLASKEHPRLVHARRLSALALRAGSGVLLLLILVMLLIMADLVPTAMWRLAQSLGIEPYELGVVTGFTMAAVYAICCPFEARLLLHLTRRLSDEYLGEHAKIAGIGASLSPVAYVVAMWSARDVSSNVSLLMVAFSLVTVLLFWLWMSYVSWLGLRLLWRAWRMAAERYGAAAAAAR